MYHNINDAPILILVKAAVSSAYAQYVVRWEVCHESLVGTVRHFVVANKLNASRLQQNRTTLQHEERVAN
jgi:hypothetical protein